MARELAPARLRSSRRPVCRAYLLHRGLWFWGGWNGIGLFIGGLLVIALCVAMKLAKLPLLPGNVQV